MKVLILGNLFTYPSFSAAAASSRVSAYARGFVQNQVPSIVITLSNEYGYEKTTYEDGFKCFVALQQLKRNKYFLIRRYYKIKKYFNVISFINNEKKYKEPISAIILYTRSPLLMIYAKLLALYFSTLLILEVTEHPLYDFKKYSLWKIFFPGAIYPFFNGFICISKSLHKYCEQYKHTKASIINIPPLVDFVNFKGDFSIPIKDDYLLYSGSLTIHRDGIDNLIKSFHLVSKSYPSLKLVLGGKWYDEQTKKEIFHLVKTLQLDNKVIFLNFLPKKEILAYIYNVKIFCVARNDNNQTSSAFPTKIAEYLFTGRPLLVTDVGDISDYLADGENVYLSEPGNPQTFANKIEYILNNYKIALNVAKAGKKIAKSSFCNNKNVKRLKEFLEQIN